MVYNFGNVYSSNRASQPPRHQQFRYNIRQKQLKLSLLARYDNTVNSTKIKIQNDYNTDRVTA